MNIVTAIIAFLNGHFWALWWLVILLCVIRRGAPVFAFNQTVRR